MKAILTLLLVSLAGCASSKFLIESNKCQVLAGDIVQCPESAIHEQK